MLRQKLGIHTNPRPIRNRTGFARKFKNTDFWIVFEHRIVPTHLAFEAKSRDEVEAFYSAALEAGAEDIKNEGDYFEVICPMTDYDAVSQALNEREIETEESDLVYLPNVLVPIEDKESARKVLHLIEVLEDLDDVKAVHSNMDLAEGVFEDAS